MQTFQSYKPTPAKASFWQQVGLPARGIKLHQALHEGLPFEVFGKLASISGFDKQDVANATAIPRATLQRRAKSGRFNKEESDRLYRFAEVYRVSLDLFELDAAKARQWLTTSVVGLGNNKPIAMLSTSAETEAVLDLIGRLEHGVFS
ncbi:type II RES/Xre toxin-antitoxin system antitoxin [Vibrio intestinalis]|uniref:type II RES/Xre toxin-antitoxin system antitoxin n=1 Tax=Vibrio intestinalis TaxID=2933291 RepID=UPI0021A83852|nr:antitoxin Xre-like helix-turn-helix domain-containing protein [Vibrio intestinalis]